MLEMAGRMEKLRHQQSAIFIALIVREKGQRNI